MERLTRTLAATLVLGLLLVAGVAPARGDEPNYPYPIPPGQEVWVPSWVPIEPLDQTKAPVCTQDSARGSDKFEVPGDISQQDANDLKLAEGTEFCVFGGEETAQTGAIYGEADGVTRLQDYLPDNPSGEKPDVSHYVTYQTPEEPWEPPTSHTPTSPSEETTTTTVTPPTTDTTEPTKSTSTVSETESTPTTSPTPVTLPYTGPGEMASLLLKIVWGFLLVGMLLLLTVEWVKRMSRW
jgi:hypothetical protein